MVKKYILWITIIAVIAILVGLVGCGPKPIEKESVLDTPENHYSQGLREFNRKDYAKAIEEFERAKALDPKYPGAYVGIALVLAEQKSFEKALDNVNKAIDLDDKFIDAYIAKGRILTKRRKGDDWIEDAVKQYEKALKIDPNSEAAYYYMGITYKQGFRFRDAEEAFGKVVAMKGEYADEANKEWELVQKIVRAAPGTKLGAKIALIDEIDRADLAVLLIEELKLLEILEKKRPKTYDTGFKPPESPLKYKQPEPKKELIEEIPDIKNHWAKNWIVDIVKVGGMELTPAHKFNPDEKITRATFANIVQNILIDVTGDQSLATKYIGETSHFPDVPSSHWAYNAIALCVDRGIMKANTLDGSIGINKPVSGADALLMIRQFQNVLRMTF
ncbi:hypothetical protein DRQ15_08900 [candidate division KSB1 bacterium]|nr:MAG: hypothetical protein DRQ00_11505 [candidate division KSB1 bacterium]RKY89596.1 MAG: hypothetical protein DRQ15_08900 [candidate division KSB1 bacterium]